MNGKRALGLGLYWAALVAAMFGFQAGDAVVDDIVGRVPIILEFLGVKHPHLVLILLAFGVGAYLIPAIISMANRHTVLEEFEGELRQIGNAKDEFFSLISRAYANSANGDNDVILRFNDSVQNMHLDKYNGMPIKAEPIDCFLQPPNVENADFVKIYYFVARLTEETQEYKQHAKTPSLLNGDEISRLDVARRDITQFWDHAGRQIQRRRLRYKSIVKHLDSNSAFLKILPYMAVNIKAYHQIIGPGPFGLYYLSARYLNIMPGFLNRLASSVRNIHVPW